MGVFFVISLLGACQAAKYLTLGIAGMSLTALVLELLIVLMAWAAWQGRMPFLLLAVAVGGFVLNSFFNYAETTKFASFFMVQGIIAGAWAIVGTVYMVRKKEKPARVPWLPLTLILLTLISAGWVWKINVDHDRKWDGHAKHMMWAVPEKFDTGEIAEKGTVGELIYETKAYATDGRAVTTANSVLCGCLDYVSYFGLFSSFRTTEEHIRETIQSEEQRELPIHYLYATTGNFDFATPYMVPGYRMLCEVEPRMEEGINTSMDLFPMRYHSIGHWHLSLYNFLLKAF